MKTKNILNLTVGGMSCKHCANAVTATILTANPNCKVKVSLKDGSVRIISVNSIDTAKTISTITDAGFEPKIN